MTTETQTSPSWDYKGTTITFDVERAVFRVTQGKRKLTAPSLDAMKRKLDEAREFAGFTGYVDVSMYYALREIARGAVEIARFDGERDTRVLLRVEVVAFDRKEREYLMADGKRADSGAIFVADDEAAFIAVWTQYHEANKRKEARVAQLDAEINEIRARFKTRSPREEQ